MRMKKSIVLLLLLPVLLFAQKGKISGLVSDAATDEALPGVNVLVEGTYLGASSDLDGFYTIADVKEGDYTLEIQYVGYKVTKVTGVKILGGETTVVNIKLEPTILALGQEIVVVGEKPLFDIKETASSRTLNSDEIAAKAVENVQALVAQQTGVVETDNEVHIRGSRSHEAAFLLDDISVQDPLAGTGFGLNLSKNAIEEVEVLTGGFRAEYGQATSGVINVRTKSGGDNYSGSFTYKSDHWGVAQDQPFSFFSDMAELTLGGPEPINKYLFKPLGLKLPGDFYFFTNLYMMLSDDYTRTSAKQLYSTTFYGTEFAPRENNNWSGLFKLTWKLSPVNTFVLSYNKSIAINQNTQTLQTKQSYEPPNPGFPYEYSQILDSFNTITHNNDQVSLTWTHTLDKANFFDLKLSRYFTNQRSDNGGNWDSYVRALDVTRLPVQYFMPDSNRVRVIPGDGFYDGGNASYWHDHWVDEWTLIGSITSHAIENHQLKAGFNARFQEMQLIDIVQPYLNDGWGSSQDIYKVSPAMGGLYLQDDITFSGMILNAGVRLDYWFPGKYVDDAIADTSLFILTPAMRQQYKDETYSLFDRRFKMRISPRIGVSHPVSENMMLFFNYGHFSKWPKPQFVYAKLGPTSASGSFQKFGNPNLNPETTVSYELGVRNKFSKDDVLSVTAFYKDIFDYIQTTTIRGIPRIGSAVFYLNLDYARSRGIEIDYKTRIGNNFTASLGGSYSIVTTKNSSPNVQDLIYLGVIDEEPIRETFAIWDRPLQGNMSLNYYRPKNDKWDLFGLDMPTDWNLNFYWVAMSGKRYTPAVFDQNDPLTGRPLYSSTRDEDQLNSKIGGIWSWADLTFEKYFDLTEQMKMTFSLEVLNIFNFKNTNIVNPVTGRAYEYGDPVPSSWNDPLYPDISWPISEPYPFNPARYKNPRNIRAGLSLTF